MNEGNWRDGFDKMTKENGGELPEHLRAGFEAAALGNVLHREKKWAAQFPEEDEAGTFSAFDAVTVDDETGCIRVSDIGVMADDFGDISLTPGTADTLGFCADTARPDARRTGKPGAVDSLGERKGPGVMNRKRKCATCGFESWAGPGDEFCSSACAGSVAMGTALLAVQQFARAQADRR